MTEERSEGRSESLEAVFDRHFGDVYRYVAFRLAPDAEAARDVTQEVFLAAIQGWPAYRGDGSILAWLRGIARRKVVDHLRLRGERPCQADAEALAELAAGRRTPQERALLLAQVLRSLPAECVDLLEQKYLDGLSVCQIAAEQNRTPKAVESALARARQMLKDRFLRLQSREERRDEPIRP